MKKEDRFTLMDLIDCLGFFGASYMKIFGLVGILAFYYSNGGSDEMVIWTGFIFTALWITKDWYNSFYRRKR